MAQNKTKPETTSVDAFVASVSDDKRRADTKALVRLMHEVTGESPKMWGSSIIGFGSHHYRYESGREGDTPMVGFSPRSSACVLYGLLCAEGGDPLLARLGKTTQGKGCLYIKKLADVDMAVLRELVARSAAARRS
jgi:hypothetical protein